MTLSQNRRIYLDSSVYIAFLKGEQIPAAGGMTRVALARLIFGSAEAGRADVFTSAITLVEVRKGNDAPQVSSLDRLVAIDALFDRTSTRFVEVGRVLAISAREVANKYGLNLADAIHVASAMSAGCAELFIWDESVVRKISGSPVPGLSVCEPHWNEQLRMDD